MDLRAIPNRPMLLSLERERERGKVCDLSDALMPGSYLDIRKERKKAKQLKKVDEERFESDQDNYGSYDSRRFFDEVAYEPPKLKARKKMRKS